MKKVTESERKIIDAAKKIFERYGYTGARMQMIADEAQISKASLHYYFRSKEKLFDHIFHETMEEFMPLISTWEDNEDDWQFKLRTFILNFFQFLQKKSMLFILREINRDPSLMTDRKDKVTKKKNRFIAYFDRLMLEGKIKEIDVRLIYIFMHSLCAFPILNSTLFKMNTQMNDEEYASFLEKYPHLVADFIIQTIHLKNN